MLDHKYKDRILARLISGKFRIKIHRKIYIINHPSRDIRTQAEDIYETILRNNKYNDWLNLEKAQLYLISLGIWSFDGDNNLKAIDKRIEDLKVEIYNAGYNTDLIDKYKKELSLVKIKQHSMLTRKHCLDYATIEGYADNIKSQFLILNSVTDKNGAPIKNMNYLILDRIVACLSKLSVDIEIYRELARTEPWKSYWYISKETPFDTPIIDLTDAQKTIVLYSKMYDQIYESPDCPDEDIIQDDDKLDGWLIKQKRDQEKERKQERLKKLTDKYGKAQEVFLVTDNPEHAKEIHELNTDHARKLKQQREAQIIGSKQPVAEIDFPDKQQELKMLATKNFAKMIKNKGR